MKTSEAEANGKVCPKCGDELTTDIAKRGFVRHKTDRECKYGQRDRDPQVLQETDHLPEHRNTKLLKSMSDVDLTGRA